MTLFQSSLSRARSVLESFIEGFSGTIICDGYSAYDKIEGVTFANCWAHTRRYWLKADSKNGQIGVKYCVYWGKDLDTKEVVTSPAYHHGVAGEVTIRVVRTVDMLLNFEDSSEFDSVEIISSDFEERYYHSCFEDDYDDIPDAYGVCPDCARKINVENDGGNGFCTDCAPNH